MNTGARTGIRGLVALAALGCGGPTRTPLDTGGDWQSGDGTSMDATDGAMDAALDARDVRDVPDIAIPDDVHIGAMGYVYVLSSLPIDTTDSPTVAHTGFDIDGLASTATDAAGCNYGDFFSMLDLDQNRPSGCLMGATGCVAAVDNAMPHAANRIDALFAGSNVRSYIASQIANYRMLYLMRLTGVDSFVDDPAVAVHLYRGFTTFNTVCTSVFPGRTYRVDRTSLAAGATTLDQSITHLVGSIVGGRLHVQGLASDTIDVPVSPTVVAKVHAPTMRVDITPTAGTQGNLGGYYIGDELAATAVTAYGWGLRLVIWGLVGEIADIRRAGVCYDTSTTPPHFGDVSVGAGMSLMSAVIDPVAPVADGPTTGNCGAP